MAHPLLYEINTRCWLRELAQANRRPITLGDVPEAEFLSWQRLGFSHIWLMGVWSGGPRARAQALASPDLRRAYAEALPDWKDDDVRESPYAIAAYQVADALGGNQGLAQFRARLHSFGLKLILDLVPNHVGLDHPWVSQRPGLFVQAPGPRPGTFPQETASGKKHLAFGRDPNWAPWTDTVQLEYRNPQTRDAMSGLLLELAAMCDGVRCDMAMLVLNDVFARTWQGFPAAGAAPSAEFWAEAISRTRQAHPEFLFLGEVYWGLEARLQALGFDYTYDKPLYDQLVNWEPGGVQRHVLGLGAGCRRAGAHFLENHDEPRIASRLPLADHRAAALVILGLPGLRFLHEGQLQGALRRLPVQLVRRALEPPDGKVVALYQELLGALGASLVGKGNPELLTPRAAWPDNPTAQHFILVQWMAQGASFDLVVVNLAPHASQCYAPVQLPADGVTRWEVRDRIGPQQFTRDREDLLSRGLYLDVPAHGAQILRFEPGNP